MASKSCLSLEGVTEGCQDPYNSVIRNVESRLKAIYGSHLGPSDLVLSLSFHLFPEQIRATSQELLPSSP
jgi:hypothetical protein